MTIRIAEMFCAYALQFRTRLAPQVMFARLLADRSWGWFARDSDRWGDYVATTEVPGVPGVRLRVYSDEPEPGQYVVNVSFRSDAANAPALEARLRKLLMTTLLPSIEACDVVEIEFLE